MSAITRTPTVTLDTISEQINEHHRAALTAAGQAVMHGMRCGELLAEQKSQLGHGEFGPWLAEHFEGTDRTARNYMRLHARRAEISQNGSSASVLSIRGALRLLAADQEPERESSVEVQTQFERDHPELYADGRLAEREVRIARLLLDQVRCLDRCYKLAQEMSELIPARPSPREILTETFLPSEDIDMLENCRSMACRGAGAFERLSREERLAVVVG